MASSIGKKKKLKVNPGRVLKTLVRMHGIQILLSGTSNADLYPGNVVILLDGRLRLLDYGMVGRLSLRDRETIAKTIVALSDNDKTTARINQQNGYKVRSFIQSTLKMTLDRFCHLPPQSD